MAKQPRVFSDLYVNMVRAGEQSGSLVEVLRRMANHFQQFAEVQAKFTSALIYPAMVCCVGAGIIAFFMFFMMPRVHGNFQRVRRRTAMPTRMLMGFSNFFAIFGGCFGLLIIVAIILFKRFQASAEGARMLDEWKLNAPVFGKVMKLNLFGHFARTLGRCSKTACRCSQRVKSPSRSSPTASSRKPSPKRATR